MLWGEQLSKCLYLDGECCEQAIVYTYMVNVVSKNVYTYMVNVVSRAIIKMFILIW